MAKYKVGDIVEIATMPEGAYGSDYPYNFVFEMRREAGKKLRIIQVHKMLVSQSQHLLYTEPYYYVCETVKGEEYDSHKFAGYLPSYKWVEAEFVQCFNEQPLISIF